MSRTGVTSVERGRPAMLAAHMQAEALRTEEQHADSALITAHTDHHHGFMRCVPCLLTAHLLEDRVRKQPSSQ